MQNIIFKLLCAAAVIAVIICLNSANRKPLRDLDDEWSYKYNELKEQYESLSVEHEELQSLVNYIAELLEEGEYKEAKSILCD